jgi:dimeric dUTPase (all-alpha-NTP-PPase superfamily)
VKTLNIEKLFEMQKELDTRIQNEHELQNENLVERKILALLVELGELANETRCFKFWSKRPSSSKEVVLEEYVDGLHFILSLGIEKGFEEEVYDLGENHTNNNLVTSFMDVYSDIDSFRKKSTIEAFHQMLVGYLALGQALEFTYEEIEHAYIGKNTINHERQNNGY